MYVHGGPFDEEVDFHTTKILTSLSALGPILKDFFFWGTGVNWCESRTLGLGRHYR